MKINRIFLIAVVAIVGLNLVPVQVASANPGVDHVVNTTQSLTPPFVEGEVLVKILDDPSFSKLDQGLSLSQRHDLDARVSLELPHEGSLWVHLVARDGRSTNDLLRELGDNQSVILEEVVYLRKACYVPNDPNYRYQQSSLEIANAGPDFYDFVRENPAQSEVWMGYLDSGVDYNNVDLQDQIIRTHGINTVTPGGDIMDDSGHGTSVIAVALAEADNASFGASVGSFSPVKAVVAKVLGSDNKGTTAQVVGGINYLADLALLEPRLRVVNASLGGFGRSLAERDAISRLALQDVIFVTGSGNDSRNIDTSPAYPASWGKILPNVITVGAGTSEGFSDFSNFGVQSVTLVTMPGMTTIGLGNTTVGGAGTSNSSSIVAVSAAIVATYNPQMTAWQLRQRIIKTAARQDSLEGKCQTGAMLDALAAVSTEPTLDSLDVLETKGKVKYASATSIVTIKIASTDPGAVITVLGYEAVIKIKPAFQKIKLTNVKIRPAGSDLWFTVISSKGGVLYIMGDGSSSQRWPAT